MKLSEVIKMEIDTCEFQDPRKVRKHLIDKIGAEVPIAEIKQIQHQLDFERKEGEKTTAKPEKKFIRLRKLCEAFTDKDMATMLSMADMQASYISPLKSAKQRRLNDMGEYNKRVLKALSNLRDAFKTSPM